MLTINSKDTGGHRI